MLRLKSIKDNKKYIIDEDLPGYGFNLYVFESNECIADYVQDTLKIIKEFAFEKFAIPITYSIFRTFKS